MLLPFSDGYTAAAPGLEWTVGDRSAACFRIRDGRSDEEVVGAIQEFDFDPDCEDSFAFTTPPQHASRAGQPGMPGTGGWSSSDPSGESAQEEFFEHGGSRRGITDEAVGENWSWKTGQTGWSDSSWSQSHENWSWNLISGSLFFEVGFVEDELDSWYNEPATDDPKGKVKIAGELPPECEKRHVGKVSSTYPPVFRAKLQESYAEWKRGVMFWIGSEGGQLPPELIWPRMMVQLKDRAARLVKRLWLEDVNRKSGMQKIFDVLEKSPLTRQVAGTGLMSITLSKAAGESMESYITLPGVGRICLAWTQAWRWGGMARSGCCRDGSIVLSVGLKIAEADLATKTCGETPADAGHMSDGADFRCVVPQRGNRTLPRVGSNAGQYTGHQVMATVSAALHEVLWSLKELVFKVILDIGCMPSAAGLHWVTALVGKWPGEGRWFRVNPESEVFKFGDGEVLRSRYRISFLGSFGGQPLVYGFSIVDRACRSPSFLESRVRAMIDCEHHSVISRKLGYGLNVDSSHYTTTVDECDANCAALPEDYQLTFGMDAAPVSSSVLQPERPDNESPDCPRETHGSRESQRQAAEMQAVQRPSPDQGVPDDPGHLGQQLRSMVAPKPATTVAPNMITDAAAADLTQDEIKLLNKRHVWANEVALNAARGVSVRALRIDEAAVADKEQWIWLEEAGIRNHLHNIYSKFKELMLSEEVEFVLRPGEHEAMIQDAIGHWALWSSPRIGTTHEKRFQEKQYKLLSRVEPTAAARKKSSGDKRKKRDKSSREGSKSESDSGGKWNPRIVKHGSPAKSTLPRSIGKPTDGPPIPTLVTVPEDAVGPVCLRSLS
ncbi:unnamed protein product [Symbiodinium sp. KB8]|nr:unnamed protein product [Symbiodinium sp. KB8]